MKTMMTIAILGILAVAGQVSAQTDVLTYDFSRLPGEQGFDYSSSCGTNWSLNGGVLEFRSCVGNAFGSARYFNLLDGLLTVQIDLRMRILRSVGYAFEFAVAGNPGNGTRGRYIKIQADDFPDAEYHDLTIFFDFTTNATQIFVDGIPNADIENFSWNYFSRFVMGDGNSSGTEGDVDIIALSIVGNLVSPVGDDQSTWGGVKSLYR